MPEPAERFDAESVREAWDHAADAYALGQDAGRDHYRYAFFGPAQVALCGDVAGRRLLDVGCGSGYFAREMARRGARVTGVDIAPRMIAHARDREAREPLGIVYDVADAADLAARFDAGAFDMATSCLALQDMPAPDAVLRAVHALLRPGGRLVVSIAHPCTDTPVRALREPRPTAEALRAYPDLEDAARVPYFLLLDLARAGA